MTEISPSDYDLDGTTAFAQALQADYAARSEAVLSHPGAQLDLAYGPDPRQRLDIFPAGLDAPVLVFFHGGYWRTGSKDGRRFPATAWADLGVAWVPVNYRLVPEHRLEDAVADARAALVWLAGNAARLGLGKPSIHLVGNSAGGHLAAMTAAAGWPGRPVIDSLTAASALVDLVPLLDAQANDWLSLDAPRAQALSPIHYLPPADLPVLVAWGGEESAAFEFQSNRYADALDAHGNLCSRLAEPGRGHFEIIKCFAEPSSDLFQAMAHLIGAE